jgi:hypothetical protein
VSRDRWVIVVQHADGVFVIGPADNRTYASSETARKDADQIEDDYELVEVERVRGILTL